MARREIFNCTDDEKAQLKLVKFKSNPDVLVHSTDSGTDSYVWLNDESIDEVIEFLRPNHNDNSRAINALLLPLMDIAVMGGKGKIEAYQAIKMIEEFKELYT